VRHNCDAAGGSVAMLRSNESVAVTRIRFRSS
jgi:hypothetical protein